jgi:methionyl-tRNA formyltransferase
MKILFMGTPEYAARSLEKIIQSGHEVIGVVTQPDKQKGRGQAMNFSPVKELALKHGLTLYQPVKVREADFLAIAQELAPEAIIVAAFGQILPKALLDIPPFGCINVHASLLPKYRGAAPIQYSILEGEEETGITIMYMNVGIDTGDIILQAKTPIAPEETGGSLYDKLAVIGADLLIEALKKIEDGTAVRVPQDDTKATYVKTLNKDMGILDFTQPAIKLERLIRGLNPWPSAYTFLEGKTLKIWQAAVEDADPSKMSGLASTMPGEVIEIRKDSIVVLTGDGLLVVKELQLEGKKRMAVDAFLRGYSVAVGTKLG